MAVEVQPDPGAASQLQIAMSTATSERRVKLQVRAVKFAAKRTR